jgi:replication factor C subunit 3/5
VDIMFYFQMTLALNSIAKKENFSLPDDLASRIVSNSGGNMRKAVLMMEALFVQQYPFSANQTLPIPDWESFIKGIAMSILRDQSPKRYLCHFSCFSLQEIRTKLYTLLSNCIPSEIILKVYFHF